jgi:hypothetical protein
LGQVQSDDPYFLYAASNAGSLLGLLSYPFLLEPVLRLRQQAWLWAGGYGVFLLLVFACALLVWRAPQQILADAMPGGQGSGTTGSDGGLSWRQSLRLVALAFVPSSLMLGVTTTLTTDIPAIPLFWVLPLALYLLSFVLVFAPKTFIPHRWLSRRLPLLILVAAIPFVLKGVLPLAVMLVVDLLALFVVALVCHGEIALSRPSTRHLTAFYLWVSLGGVLGGCFNALLVPLVFSSLAEMPIALVAAALLQAPGDTSGDSLRARWLDYLLPAALGLAVAVATLELQSRSTLPERMFNLIVFGPAAVCCLRFGSRPRRFGAGVAALILASQVYAGPYGRIIRSERSFYGIYRIGDDLDKNTRVLYHGGTAHGVQSLDRSRACEPLAYYTRSGPVGQVFAAFQNAPIEKQVAIIGLGAGAMACYQQSGQQFTFYEIDPTVLKIASQPEYFTYLPQCAPTVRVVLGDARLSIQKAPPQAYGMIMLDAFSGDSIPTHLLTREALALYLDKLAPGGIVAYHISNRYLDLHGVLGNLAHDAGLICLMDDDAHVSAEETRAGKFASWWVVMARKEDDLAPLTNNSGWTVAPYEPGARVWTDDFSNVLSILRFR